MRSRRAVLICLILVLAVAGVFFVLSRRGQNQKPDLAAGQSQNSAPAAGQSGPAEIAEESPGSGEEVPDENSGGDETDDGETAASREQAAEEKRFYALLKEGSLDEAEECLSGIRSRNADTNRLSGEQLDEMELRLEAEKNLAVGFWRYSEAFDSYYALNDEAGMQKVIAAMKEAGSDSSLYHAYHTIGDEEGMRAAIEAMEAEGSYTYVFSLYQEDGDTEGMLKEISVMEEAGRYRDAFSCALKMGDLERADRMIREMPEEESVVSSAGDFTFGQELSDLMETGEDTEAALAEALVDKALKDCGSLIGDNRRSVAYIALGQIKESSAGLWTEEAQQLMDSCVTDPPAESRILRDSGITEIVDRSHTATITAYNNNASRGMVLQLISNFGEDGLQEWGKEYIAVYVKPLSHFSFTIKAGEYDASVSTGMIWYGDREGYGFLANWTPAEVVNSMYSPEKGDRLEGSYSISVE